MYHNVHYPVAALGVGVVKSPGLCSIQLFRQEDVLTWPSEDPETGILSSSIVLKEGKLIYLLESIYPSLSFAETHKSSNAGYYFETTVTGSLMGSTAAHHLTIGTLIHHEWGMILRDKNGVTRLIGNQDSGADLLANYTTGQGTESRKTELTFKWQHPQPAPIYTATAFDIIIGGVTITAGCITLVKSFEVGATGSPMNEGDILYINDALVNKKVLVIVDALSLPVDDNSGDIDWTGSIDRHVEKALASNTINFIGSVATGEKIQIYAYS